MLEDLHWGDVETVDLLRALARHHTPAKFLIVATYVGSEVSPAASALTRLAGDLQTLQPCAWMPIGPLTEAHIRGYLEARFGMPDLDDLARPLCKMTERKSAETGHRHRHPCRDRTHRQSRRRMAPGVCAAELEPATPEGLSAPMLWPGAQSRRRTNWDWKESAFVGSEVLAGTTGRLGRTP